jgi:hypothetical protein
MAAVVTGIAATATERQIVESTAEEPTVVFIFLPPK